MIPKIFIICGYNVNIGGRNTEQIRFSEFSRPWISSEEKLSEYRKALARRHGDSFPNKSVSIDFIIVNPPEDDPKFNAIADFLGGEQSSLSAIARKNGLSVKDVRNIVADYVKRSKDVKTDCDNYSKE